MPAEEFLDSVIGHAAAKQQLSRLVSSGAIPHALVFGGPAGVGKLTTALSFAGMLFAHHAEESTLNSQAIRTALRAGTYPDLHVLTVESGKKDIAADDVRALCAKLHLKPYYPSCSIAIIDEAHRMSVSASNALLMTLEEPVENCYLFLVSSAPHRLLPTITSRCQLQPFSFLSNEECSAVFNKALSPHLEDATLVTELVSLMDGSLSALELGDRFDSRTKLPTDVKALREHLSAIGEKVRQMNRELNALGKESGAPNPISFASEVAGDDDGLPLFWGAFRQIIRRKLRASPANASGWGSLLERAVTAEQQIAERNLSVHAFLPSLLLEFSELQRR